ncbi:MAG: sulfite exporter TauE/SafE family protein [Chloroflexi bacterium]|nr:sulfite exporter TauE/SafE family protein [Chloroflexota bacterium]MDA1148029.1 sulfite exporter TauE/SafE family protein [Chloroflexota bacterium]
MNETLVALLIGLAGGTFGGLLGIGGGTLYVPALVLILGQDQRVAQAVSLVVIIPTAISATTANLRGGYVDKEVALLVTPAAVLLALGGGFLAGEIPSEWLSRIFGVVVLYVGTRSLLKNWRTPAPAPAPAQPVEAVEAAE